MTEHAGGAIGGRLVRVLITLVLVPVAGLPFIGVMAIDSLVIAAIAEAFGGTFTPVFTWVFGLQMAGAVVFVLAPALVGAWNDDEAVTR